MSEAKDSTFERKCGTTSKYQAGCRCAECVRANREYSRIAYRRVREKKGLPYRPYGSRVR